MTSSDLAYDIYKHLITLDTGATVILIGLVEKLFRKPIWKGTMAISLISFVVSIFGCLTMLVIITAGVASGDHLGNEGIVYFAGSLGTLTAWAGFLIGILGLVFFGIRNLYSSDT